MCACLKRVFSSVCGCGCEMVVLGHVFCLCVLVALQAQKTPQRVLGGGGGLCAFFPSTSISVSGCLHRLTWPLSLPLEHGARDQRLGARGRKTGGTGDHAEGT